MSLTAAQQKAIDQLGFLPEEGVWRVGPHAIVVGDLEDPAVSGQLEELGPWDLAWTDPPWSRGIGGTFRRQAGVEGPANLETLFRVLGSVLGWVREAALIWTNEDLKTLAVGALYEAGFEQSLEAKVTYSRFSHGTPVTIGLRNGVSPDRLALDGLHGGRAIASAFVEWYSWWGHKPCRLVDPFVGQDVGASIASPNVHLTGAEIHSGRAAVTLARLAKLTKKTPVLG